MSWLAWTSPAAALSPGQVSNVGTDPERWHDAPRPRMRAGDMLGFMGWGLNVPLGSMRAFAANPSLLGLEAQFRAWLLSSLSIGVSGEWATFFDERRRETYAIDGMTITAASSNSIQTIDARVLVHYYPLHAGLIRPYVGPFVGVAWSVFDVEAAGRTLSDSETSLALGFEGGAVLPLGERAPLVLLNLRYSYLPTAEFQQAVDDVQTAGMLVGVGF